MRYLCSSCGDSAPRGVLLAVADASKCRRAAEVVPLWHIWSTCLSGHQVLYQDPKEYLLCTALSRQL